MSDIYSRNVLIGYLSTLNGYRDYHPGKAEEILRHLDRVGLVIVPIEPTIEMLGGDDADGASTVLRSIWRDMVMASPTLRT